MTKGTGTFFLFVVMLISAIFLVPELSMNNGIAYGAFTNSPTIPNSDSAPQLTIAGKLVDPHTDKWVNGFLVLLYLDGEEVGRVRTDRGKFSPAGQGVYDGMFELNVPNVYELKTTDEFRYTNGDRLVMQNAVNADSRPTQLFTWFENITPGTIVRINVPDKRIQYALVILNLPEDSLPLEIQENPTTLDGSGTIAAVKINPPTDPVTTTPTIESGSWNRELRGISGSLFDIYTYYVQDQVPGLSWDTFQMNVLHYNPQLSATAYTFQVQEAYLLPDLPLIAH